MGLEIYPVFRELREKFIFLQL